VKSRTIIFVGVGLLLAAAVAVLAVLYLVPRSVQSRIGPPHTFELSEPPRFLTEELALARAREALGRDGYNVATWQPWPSGRTTAPDGSKDEFVIRNTDTPNRVVIMFTNGLAPFRFVSVELDGSRVVCRTSIAK